MHLLCKQSNGLVVNGLTMHTLEKYRTEGYCSSRFSGLCLSHKKGNLDL